MDNLNPFDIVVLSILVLSAFWGGMRGVVAQIATIASWVVSWIVSARYYTVVEHFISESNEWRTPIATVVIFFACSIVIRILATFLKKFISVAGFKEVDRQAGALFGVIKGALFCLLITFFAVIAAEKTRDLVNTSKSGPFFISVIGRIQDRLPQSEIKEQFQHLIKQNKEKEMESDSVESSLDSLKAHLTTQVLTEAAQQFVEEAEKAEQNGGINEKKQSSSFMSFLSGLKNMSAGISSWQNREADKLGVAETTKGTYSTDEKSALEKGESKYEVSAPIREPYSNNEYARVDNVASNQTQPLYSNEMTGDRYSDDDSWSNVVQSMTETSAYKNAYGANSASSSSAYGSSNNQYANYAEASSGFAPYGGGSTTYAATYGPADDSSAYSPALANNEEFGFRTRSTSSRDSSTTRRRTSNRSASRSRLGSYSYSSNY